MTTVVAIPYVQDLRKLAEAMETQLAMWPAMDEEVLPAAALHECIAILHDAAACMDQTVPPPEQQTLM